MFEKCSNFHSYRGTTTVPNQEILDFSMFGEGKFIVQELVFIPDTSCNITLNNRNFTDLIEDGLEIKPEHMNINSVKIVEQGISFYVMYHIG